jgi:hypothetical protein
MHKIIAVLISSTILLNSFQIGIAGLSQAGELLEHMQYHSDNYGDNFSAFLSKHYGKLKDDHNKNHKEERQKHKQLPFHQEISQQIFSVFLMPKQERPVLEKSQIKYRSACFFYKESSSHYNPEKLLHPPRFS